MRDPILPGHPASSPALVVAIVFAALAALAAFAVILALVVPPARLAAVRDPTATATTLPTLTPTPFDPNVGAPLPNNRIVLFYGIPGAAVTGPAGHYPPGPQLADLLKQQGDAYIVADPTHPVMLGLDLVTDVADNAPGPDGLWSHRLDPALIQQYIDFCAQYHLLLFFDLQFGWSSVANEVNAVLPYLARYPFTELAIDPEFAFPPGTGIPDVDVGHLDASEINWAIRTVGDLALAYHIPRKVVMIHEFRPEMLTHKDQIIQHDPRVSVVLHTDGFGATADKIGDYQNYVTDQWLSYGGFKIFYWRDPAPVMTPAQIVALSPPPMLISYGN